MAEGKFAGAYDLLFSHYLKSVRKKIMNIVKKYGCKNVIDLGCGTGEQCRMLFNEGMKVVGVDASLHMINYARKVSSAGTKYLVSDILSLDTKKIFDCAILSFVLHGNTMEEQEKILEKAKEMTKNGIVIIADYGEAENIKGKVINVMIKIIEGMAEQAHSRNYRLYVKNGGLRRLMKGQEMLEQYSFYGGVIRIVVINSS